MKLTEHYSLCIVCTSTIQLYGYQAQKSMHDTLEYYYLFTTPSSISIG